MKIKGESRPNTREILNPSVTPCLYVRVFFSAFFRDRIPDHHTNRGAIMVENAMKGDLLSNVLFVISIRDKQTMSTKHMMSACFT
jgi:uncharacterized protein YqkB